MQTTNMPHSESARVKTNGIELVCDTFGDRAARPLLLIQGLGMQMIAWDDEFCAALADRGYWVIRFDNRDIGLSTKFDAAGVPDIPNMIRLQVIGKPVQSPYTLTDMAEDTAGLLDALGIKSAHVVGISMGGMIAQTLATCHPERVRTLTSIMSSSGAPGLPGPKPQVTWILVAPTPTDRAAYIEHEVKLWRSLSGPGFSFDEALTRERAVRFFERGLSPAGTARQLAAILASGSRREALQLLRIPTLVIHGDADPLVPVECGIDTARAIPGAELMIIEGLGHGLPAGVVPKIIDAIAKHAV